MSATLQWKRLLVLGASIMLLCFWNAQSKVVPLGADAVCFVPVAQSLVQGRGWVNTMYPAPAPVDAEHPDRFVWHGVVAPAVWAATARSDDFGDIRTAGVFVSWIGCLIFGMLLLRATRDLRWQTSAVLVISGMLGSSGYFIHNGRPESVSCAIVCLGLWVLPKNNSRWWPVICGYFLGVVAATTPTSALLLVPLVCIYQVVHCAEVGQLCGRLAVSGAATVVSMFVVIFVAGIDPVLWLGAMKLHSEKVMWGRTGGELVTYWIKDASIPLLLLTVTVQAVCLLMGLRFWLQSPNRIRFTLFHKAAFFSSVIAVLWAVWAMALNFPPLRYNLLPFLVVFALIAVSVLREHAGWERSVLVALLCFSFGPGIIGLSRQFAVWNAGKDHVLTFRDARARLIQDLREQGVSQQEVCMHDILFELAGRTDGSDIKFKIAFGYKTDLNVLVLPQTNSGLLLPPELEGFHLAVDRFGTRLPRLFGMRLANTPGGYNYAVYLRDRSGG